ncbi:MAG: hypothetical protein M1816_003936 [Peltula sp. TS41687]|nr:MAG: hypothetical protein M1816_003936 [Peltula sp. TS41687]
MKTISIFILSSLISIVAAAPLAQIDIDPSVYASELDQSGLGDEGIDQQAAIEAALERQDQQAAIQAALGRQDQQAAIQAALERQGVDPDTLDPAEIASSDDSETVDESALPDDSQPPILQSDTGLPPSVPIAPSTSGRYQTVATEEDGGIRSGPLLAQAGSEPPRSAGPGNCIGSDTCSGLATSHSFQGVPKHHPTACNNYGFDGSTAMIVALPAEFMGPEAWEANPYCNKQITLTYKGHSVDAYVADKCRPGGCKGHNIIVSTSVLRALSPGSSMLRSVSWSVNPDVSRRPLQGTLGASVSRQARPKAHVQTSRKGGSTRGQEVRHGNYRRPNGAAAGSSVSTGQQTPRVEFGVTSPPGNIGSPRAGEGTQLSPKGGTSPGAGGTSSQTPASNQGAPATGDVQTTPQVNTGSGSSRTGAGAQLSPKGGTSSGAGGTSIQIPPATGGVNTSPGAGINPAGTTGSSGSTAPGTSKIQAGDGGAGSGAATPSSGTTNQSKNNPSSRSRPLPDLGITPKLPVLKANPFELDPADGDLSRGQ